MSALEKGKVSLEIKSAEADLETLENLAISEAFGLVLVELKILNRYLEEITGLSITREDVE